MAKLNYKQKEIVEVLLTGIKAGNHHVCATDAVQSMLHHGLIDIGYECTTTLVKNVLDVYAIIVDVVEGIKADL